MIASLPPIGSTVLFCAGERNPFRGTPIKQSRGKVLKHEPAEDDWPEGATILWPKSRWKKRTGYTTFNSFPDPYLEILEEKS